MSAPALAVEHLSHGYAGRAVIGDLNLSVQPGEHRLLLGPSGSGKTTLINLLSGLLTPDRGSIIVAGEAMAGTAAQRDGVRRRHIGLVLQQIRLVSALSLTANLMLAQKLAGQPRDTAAVDQLIAEVGLTNRAHAKPRELSQGEMQRGGIARALVARPALLIAGEPTSALDDANADRIARLLLGAAEAHGSTLLMATHDARLRAFMPHEIRLMQPAEIA